MSSPTESHHDPLISALEQLSTSVQQAAHSSPTNLDNVLQKAIDQTAQLIQSALPRHAATPWLNQLSDLTPTQPSASNPATKPPSHNIHLFAPPSAQSSSSTPSSPSPQPPSSQPSSQPSPHHHCLCGVSFDPHAQHVKKPVKCIHGCASVFHTATCRRKHARQHALECPALQRNKILKQIGLSPDPDLF